MTGPNTALERSLRDGPFDEDGYRPRPLDLPVMQRHDTARGLGPVSLQRVVSVGPARRSQAAPARHYLAAAILVAIGLAAFGIVNLANQGLFNGPATEVTGPGLTETFVSPRHGYSVRHPAGWTVRPATAGWPDNQFLPVGNPGLDELGQPGVVRLLVASQPLGVGQTEDDWLASYFHPFQGMAPCATDRASWPRLSVDGASGYLDIVGCPTDVDIRFSERDVSFDALVFAGGRVYKFTMSGDVDLAQFEAVLATVRFDPSRAID